MSFSSSTTPCDNNAGTEGKSITKSQTIVTAVFMGLWCILIFIGILSAMDPVWLKELNKSGVQNEASFYKDFGDRFMNNNEYGKAIEQYIIALCVQPDYTDAAVNLAVAYIYTDRFEDAEDLLKQSLARVGNQTGVIYYNLGLLYERLGRNSDAVASYQQALGSEMSQWMVYRKLGRIYLTLGRIDDTLAALKETLRIQTDPASGYRDMLYHSLYVYNDAEHGPYIEKLLDRGDWDRALSHFDLEIIRAMNQLDPEIAETHNELGYVYMQLGNLTLASEHYNEAQVIQSRNTEKNNS